MANYEETTTGLEVQFLQMDHTDADDRPFIPDGFKFIDRQFGLAQALDGIEEYRRRGVLWKRPEEISSAPHLFTQGTSSFDIGQGSVGTCYFLAMVAHLAEHPRQLKQVIPDDAYTLGPDGDGVFHARLWRFGQWNDVYVDDYLPVYPNGRLWGAHSDSDPNEFWVALLEKAFVRFHGNYASSEGGFAENAYVTLTGGVAEKVNYEGADAGVKTFNRIRNALNAKRPAFVTSSVGSEFSGVLGLKGPHAYTVLGTADAEAYGVCLLKIRNPWGHSEWTGPWSDRSPEYQRWKGKPPKDDGEFWIDLDNFMKYFCRTTICNLSPDFDQDGKPDTLKYVTNTVGKWTRDTSGGWKNRLKNPRLKFTIPQTGVQEVPIVVQLHQKRESRKEYNGLQVRCDLYKVKKTFVERLDDVARSIMFTPKTLSTWRYKLKPGTYLIVLSTFDVGVEKDFLMRLYTPMEVTGASVVSLNEHYNEASLGPLSAYGETFDLDYLRMVGMAWVGGVNVGGHSGCDTFATNPQILIKIGDRTAVRFILTQEEKKNKQVLGLRLHPYPSSITEEEVRALKRAEVNALGKVRNSEGKDYVYIRNVSSIESDYVLNPNTWYILLIFSCEARMNPDDYGVLLTKLNLGVLSSAQLCVKAFQAGLAV